MVKELVENGVDAGATNIGKPQSIMLSWWSLLIIILEIRFKNQGLDSIEVQDNGGGISPDNYETLALKHYTSKLSTYEDLTSLETFGFRGEALSSLCALSRFSVTTCLASDAPKGSRLEFETSGKLRGTSVIAAQKGTTVHIEGLFHNLPVRRRELERNIKREWNKVIGVLNQYACILTGVKFTVSQQPNKGKKIVLFSTKGNNTTRENIVNVFGAKTLTVLIALELKLELEPTSAPSQRRSTQENGSTKEIQVRGHVSRPTHGEGRQTPDRQMFFVNGRPCGLPQFAKVFNEVYKTYNSSQSPFIFADIQLDTHLYDVNVSPDKRTIMLHDQSRLLDNLRESLVALFEAQDYSIPLTQLNGPKQTPNKKSTISRQSTSNTDDGRDKLPITSRQDNHAIGQTAGGEAVVPANELQGNGHMNVEATGTPQRQSAVSGRLLGQNDENINLMSGWLQKANSRQEVNARVAPQVSAVSRSDTPRSDERLPSRLGQPEQEPNEVVSSDKQIDTSREKPHVSRKVTDFNTCLDALSRGKTSTEMVEIEVENMVTAESPIPSITTPSRVSETQNVRWSPPRAKRTAQEIATITIDGETVTSVIGTPAKRNRTETMDASTMGKQTGPSRPTPSIPSFQGRLTQMFSASSSSKARPEDLHIMTELVDGPVQSRSPSKIREESEGLFVENEDSEEGHSQSPSIDQRNEQNNHQANTDTLEGTDDHTGEVEVSVDYSVLEDENYVDEEEKKAQEDNRVQHMIDAAEDAGKTTSEETQKRHQNFVKGTTKRKDATTQILQKVRVDASRLRSVICTLDDSMVGAASGARIDSSADGIERDDAEEKLSLTISKSDFGKMKIVGQFNLGFILAVRQADTTSTDEEDRHATDDELFIIDQHATDEKYNFERLQENTIVQSQRLVQPKALELTAIEEEVIKENIDALETNGFQVSIDESGYQPVGSRCQLLSLPLSRETTFTLADLEELISLLTDHQSTSANTIPRPSRVRRMFAMRACRSSVMIGKSLTNKQMEKLVRHMGELDKPWNCPHGRPTMRHLCGLGAWNDSVWREGDGVNGEKGIPTDWTRYFRESH